MLPTRPLARALALALALAGCAGEGPGTGRSVVFISVDTLRADHVACYGHPRASTPAIDRLAAEGTRFDLCISSCPVTLPSHATMMTGTYPFVHGARNNVTFVLAEENLTLAEILREAGYATHAEIGSAVLADGCGLDQGFDAWGDRFVDERVARGEVQPGSLWFHDTQRNATAVTDAALAYLESRRSAAQPFFLFVHYYDPHQPHQAPEPFAGEHDDPYLAEIAYTDAELGRVLALLRTPDFAQRTLIVLTSDHGDGLGEHDEPSHGSFLYDTTLRVPLVIAAPGQLAARQVVAAQVGLVDLLPTILELLELPRPAPIQGTSLVPLLRDPSGDLELATYSETLEPRVSFGYSELRSLRTDGWKYIHGPRPELYRIDAHAAETLDLASTEAARVEALRQALRAILAQAPPLLGRGAAREVDAADLQRFAALGYASAETLAEDDDPHGWTDEVARFDHPSGENPMDRVRDMNHMYWGLGAMRDQDYATGERMWAAFVADNPRNAEAHSNLARCRAALGRGAEALPLARRALELDPERCEDRQLLGSLLAEAGQLAQAEEELRRALACDPSDDVSVVLLVKLQLGAGEFGEAIDTVERFVAQHAPQPGADTRQAALLEYLRARAFLATNRVEEAVQGLRRAVELDPLGATPRLELATLLVQGLRITEASDVYDEAVRALPADDAIASAAMTFWMENGKIARVLQLVDRGLERQPDNLPLALLRIRLLSSDPDEDVRDGARARALAQELLDGGYADNPRVIAAAAAAAAEQGDFEAAIELAERAAVHARENGAEALEGRIATELAGYRAHEPVRGR